MQNVPTLKISAAIKLTEGFLTGTNRNRRRLQKADKGNRMSFGASTSHGRRIRHGAHVYVGLTMGTLLSASQWKYPRSPRAMFCINLTFLFYNPVVSSADRQTSTHRHQVHGNDRPNGQKLVGMTPAQSLIPDKYFVTVEWANCCISAPFYTHPIPNYSKNVSLCNYASDKSAQFQPQSARKIVWRPSSARIRWGSFQRYP